jgi:hypothetical protein
MWIPWADKRGTECGGGLSKILPESTQKCALMGPKGRTIDPKWSQNGAKKLLGPTLGPPWGPERPKGAKKTRKSRVCPPRGRPPFCRVPPGGPKKTPKIEELGEMTAAGATRDRQKDTGVLRFRLFRFRALPGVILGAPGCPRGPFWALVGP